MTTFSAFYALTVLVLLIDAVYLYLMSPVWKRTVQTIQKSPLRMNVFYTFLAYVVLCVGLFVFVWQPYQNDRVALQYYAILWGVCSYGLFNFTNAAIFQEYPFSVILQDTVWGGILSVSVVTLLHHYVQRMSL